MNIIDALIAHHEQLRGLYARAEADPAAFDEYTRQLGVHHTMEEKYFYDFLVKVPEAEGEAQDGVNEHQIIEMIMLDSKRFPRDHALFPVKIEGLGEYTNHHLEDEETVIFPLARQKLAAGEQERLGGLFVQAKDALLGVVLPEAAGAGSAREARPARKKGPGKPPSPGSSGLGIGGLKE